MATYSNIGIKLITTGDESGTWGTSTNTNFSDVLDEAIAGAVTYNISSDADFTLTVSDGTSSDARHAVIKFTSTTLTATRVCTFAPNDLQKTWVVINSTTGGRSLTFKQGSAGGTVTVPNGESAIIYSDGGGSSAGAVTRVLDSFTNTKITTGTLNATTLDLTNLEVTNIKAKDGTSAASIADSTGVVSITANPILSGGTANGVLYLNGSKVATSGSALTFDGTTFGVTSTWGSNSQLFTNATASNLSGITARYNGANKGYLYFDNSTSLYNLYGEAGISLAFTANAAEGMRLTSTGLGIGTTSPSYKFQASGGKATTGIVGSLINVVSGGNVKLHFSDEITYNWTVGTTGNTFTVSSGESSTTAGTIRLQIDSSGNLGLGVTPSAWGSSTAFDIGSYASVATWSNSTNIGNNFYRTSTPAFIYKNSANATLYQQTSAGSHIWYNAPSGTAGNAITFTQAMTLDASGNLALGGTTNKITGLAGGGNGLTIQGATAPTLALYDTTNAGYYLNLGQIEADSYLWNIANGFLSFGTNNAERMRIDTSGNVGIGTASPGSRVTLGVNATDTALSGTSNTAGLHMYVRAFGVAQIDSIQSGANNSGMSLRTYNNGTYTAFIENTQGNTTTFATAGSERMRIDSSGNVGIGGTADAYAKTQIRGTLPTNSNISIGYSNVGTIPSGSTGGAYYFHTAASTATASFTCPDLYHYFTYQGSFGAGSSVTRQYGYFVDSSLTGATNNYGFYSAIASGSNRWNFYAAGTANNYFAGNTGVGSTDVSITRLRVTGAGATSATYATYMDTSGGAQLFSVRNDGAFFTGTHTNSPYNLTTASAANCFINADGALYRSTSSLRYKTDVADAAHGLADVLKLRSVTYKGKNDGDKTFGGLIAEEVHDAGLTEFVAYDKEGRPDALHYGNMVALLVKAVQELSAKVAALEAK